MLPALDTSLFMPLQLALWWQNLSLNLYCLLWLPHNGQNKGTHRLSLGWLPLLNYHCWMHLSPELCFPLLTVVVTMSPTPKAGICLSLDPLHRDSIQNSGFCAVSTADHGSYQKTPENAGVCVGGTTTSSVLHLEHVKKPHCFFFFIVVNSM